MKDLPIIYLLLNTTLGRVILGIVEVYVLLCLLCYSHCSSYSMCIGIRCSTILKTIVSHIERRSLLILANGNLIQLISSDDFSKC